MTTPPMQESSKTARTSLAKGNEAFRQCNHAQAIAHYAQAIAQQPGLAKTISFNLSMASQKYRSNRQVSGKPSVAVCGWDLAHNAAGRVYTLATIYETFADVEIIGSLFPRFGREIWEPIRDTVIAKHTFVVEDESKFIEQAIKLVASHPYDIVHLSKPRAPNIFFGILYKLLWGARVLMDIDDEELAFVGADTPISIDDYIQQHGKLPELKELAGKEWTRLAVGLAMEFDGITVCNAALKQRYGGEIIRHARDKKLFKPSPELKRQSREKYGIPQDAKVVLFFGTPREHKGLIETAQAIASLKRPDIIYYIVGSFSDESLKKRLMEVKGCNYKFLPNQPISKTSEILAIADCCVLLQDANSTAAHYQTPAKMTDAMAIGLPVIANFPVLDGVDGEEVVLLFTKNTLAEKINELLDNSSILNQITKSGFAYFQKYLSIDANSQLLLHSIMLCSNQQSTALEKICKHISNSSLLAICKACLANPFRSYLEKINDFETYVSKNDIALIKDSGLFDENWYWQKYPLTKLLPIAPVEFYLLLGARLQHDPSPNFSTSAYLEVNPDVAEAGVNPLVHYVRSGRREGRRIAPRRPAMDKVAWSEGGVQIINSLPSVLLCAHEVHEQLFGGERSFIDMLNALGEMKVNIFITVPKKDNPEYVELLCKKSCGLYYFPYGLWSKNRKPDEISIQYFSHIIEQRNIALVYCNTIVLIDPLIAARRAGRLTAVHARELINHDEHLCKRIGLDAQEIVNRVLQHTDYVITNSAATQKLFLSSRRSLLAPNVVLVDSLDMPNLFGRTVTFGIVSSNIPKKGIADFVEVARRAEKQIPNARFRVIGPENNYLAELKAAGLPENLEFSGYANTPAEAMAQVNVVLSLSHFAESFGRTVAEAQAARRPVIAYRWGGVSELIDDGQTGFVVDYKDIDAVVARVRQLSIKPGLIHTMGAAGREKMLIEFSPVVLRNNLRHALLVILGSPVALRIDDTRRLTIIVPVYNAPEAVKRCLQSVHNCTDLSRHRVLMINDGSSNARIQPLLEGFAHNPGFHLLANPQNMGYTRTINRGIAWAGDDDIVLLNSDTIVHDGWIEGLQKIALGVPKAGTVTAMGDNSGAFSFPKPNVVNPKPEGLSHDAWAKRIIGFTQTSNPVDVPTGNGFCLYIRRDLIEHIGLFDEKAFPRGYGEENDFCMRTIKAGWKNFITPHAYVFHQRTASFGAEKEGLMNTAMEIINQRYPDYAKKVKTAFGSGRMKALRTLVAKAYEDDASIPAPQLLTNVAAGAPIAESKKYRVGPEMRFLSLNQQMIDWTQLRGEAPRRDPDLVSIIVCVYNQHNLTNKCLNALVGNSGAAKIEIIMVNNASDGETSGLLDKWAERDDRITVIHNFDNLNFSLGNNIGFAASHGAKIVFLNNDTEVQPGWLEPLLAPLADPKIMGTQPKLVYPDGRVQCVGVVFSGKTPLGYPIYVDEDADSPLVTNSRCFRAITGACMAVRAVDYATVGGFDPVFINGQEDVDLCYRLGHGRPVFEYASGSTVIHHEGRTTGRGRFINHNRYTFVSRWRDAFPGDDVNYYEKDGFRISSYLPDRNELDMAEIACWKPQLEVKN